MRIPPKLSQTVLLANVLFLGLSACADPPAQGGEREDAWKGETRQVGDTLFVRTLSGSVWPGDAKLIEEMVIGAEAGGEEDLLGDIMAVDAAEGRIYLADIILTTVHVFDMDGNPLMKIGRDGGGPGEFRRITDLGIDPVRNELVVRESIGVVHRFTLDGEYLNRSQPVGQGAISGDELLLRVTGEGDPMIRQRYLLRHADRKPALSLHEGYFTLDSTGAFSDTLEVPIWTSDPAIMRAYVTHANGRDRSFLPMAVPFMPLELWTISMEGEYIGGRPSDYRFEIRHRDGGVTVIQRDAGAIPVDSREKEAAKRRVIQVMRGTNPGWNWGGPSIPDTKPFYSGIFPDRSGRLWVLREGRGHPVEGWTEPEDWKGWRDWPEWAPERWFEVFEKESGRYLGRVDIPADFQFYPEPYIRGDTLIAVAEDPMGRPLVKRYRLEIPEAGSLPGP